MPASDASGHPRSCTALPASRWALLLALAFAASAQAADLKVLTSGAFKSVLQALVPVFEQRTGHHVVLDNDTAGGLQKRIAAGEAFDVAVITPAALDTLVQSGQIAPGSPRRLARVGIGVAIRTGAPVPDISTVAAFQQALLQARAVATIAPAAGGSSGIYLWQWFEQVGIAAQLRPRAVLVMGGLAAQKLVTGEADIALQQLSELAGVPGVTVLGPVPAAIQNHTVYAGGLSASSRQAEAGRELLAVLAGPDALAVLKAKGMEAPDAP